jgi:uncharacterized protein YbjT (DUF2867 family)
MTNTILITGASGTIGRQLVSQLRDAGASVIAGSSSGKIIEGVATRHADLADKASLSKAFSGVDTLFLLLPLQSNMVDLARNAVEAAKAAGVTHIVRSSGAGADAASPFAIARVQGEIDKLVADSGIDYTITKPANFMQNFLTFYAGMVKGGTLYLPQGDAEVSFIDTRDIAAANAVILQNPAQHAGKTYTLTGAAALSNADAMASIGAARGEPVKYVAVTDEQGMAALRGMGMDEWLVDIMMSLHNVIAAGYAAGVSPDVEQLLGRAPISFRRFVADHVSAWR